MCVEQFLHHIHESYFRLASSDFALHWGVGGWGGGCVEGWGWGGGEVGCASKQALRHSPTWILQLRRDPQYEVNIIGHRTRTVNANN